MEEKKKGKKNKIYTILMLVCIIVFMFALYKVVNIIFDYKEIDDYYEKTNETFVVKSEGELISIDLEKIRALNDDVIAWIYMRDTGISYPVLQGRDNDYYLFRTYEKEYLVAGSIFMDAACNKNFTDSHTIVYGHNMYNGSMFGGLDKFKTEEYRDQHPYIYILLPDGKWNKYEIYSYYTADITDGTFTLFNEDEAEYNRYISLTTQKNVYSNTEAPASGERILTLSTCTEDSNDYKRNVIQAKYVETLDNLEE